jgi:hypothetical protein
MREARYGRSPDIGDLGANVQELRSSIGPGWAPAAGGLGIVEATHGVRELAWTHSTVTPLTRDRIQQGRDGHERRLRPVQ